jgi:hypothetical protein
MQPSIRGSTTRRWMRMPCTCMTAILRTTDLDLNRQLAGGRHHQCHWAVAPVRALRLAHAHRLVQNVRDSRHQVPVAWSAPTLLMNRRLFILHTIGFSIAHTTPSPPCPQTHPAVLPDPVLAMARQSRPSSAVGHACAHASFELSSLAVRRTLTHEGITTAVLAVWLVPGHHLEEMIAHGRSSLHGMATSAGWRTRWWRYLRLDGGRCSVARGPNGLLQALGKRGVLEALHRFGHRHARHLDLVLGAECRIRQQPVRCLRRLRCLTRLRCRLCTHTHTPRFSSAPTGEAPDRRRLGMRVCVGSPDSLDFLVLALGSSVWPSSCTLRLFSFFAFLGDEDMPSSSACNATSTRLEPLPSTIVHPCAPTTLRQIAPLLYGRAPSEAARPGRGAAHGKAQGLERRVAVRKFAFRSGGAGPEHPRHQGWWRRRRFRRR